MLIVCSGDMPLPALACLGFSSIKTLLDMRVVRLGIVND
jgi:hypothetical protein